MICGAVFCSLYYTGQVKRDGTPMESGLAEIFRSVDCATLSLPHYETDALKHLDKVADGDLLAEYRAEIACEILVDFIVAVLNEVSHDLY